MSLKNIGNYFSALGTSSKNIRSEIKGLSDIISGSSSTIFGNLSSLFGGITNKSELPILTDALKDSITLAENLSTVISESVSEITLSIDKLDEIRKSLGSLNAYDSSTLFKETANGVYLNREKLDKLTKSCEASQNIYYL